MSATKRYIEDKCEEIAKKTGLSWGEVMDIFSEVNECLVEAARYQSKEKDPIKTGFIPVEYNLYKDLIRKAKVYDKMSSLAYGIKPEIISRKEETNE